MILVIVLVIVFGVLHSLTADHRLKTWIANRIGQRTYDGWYRLVYNLISVALLMPVFLLMLLSESTVIYRVPGPLTPVFLLVQAVGLIGLLLSILQIDWMRFAGLSQVWAYIEGKPLPLPPEPLQVKGTYALVRHPLYFFSLLFLWFTPVMSDSFLAFNIGATLYFLVGSLVEERRMLRIFGEEYTTYQQRVPWMLPVPRR